jgi:hypothetical protein
MRVAVVDLPMVTHQEAKVQVVQAEAAQAEKVAL